MAFNSKADLAKSLEEELIDLRGKVDRLESFLLTDSCMLLDSAEQDLLRKQHMGMRNYLGALEERFKAAKDKACPKAYHYKLKEVRPSNLAFKPNATSAFGDFPTVRGEFVDGAVLTPSAARSGYLTMARESELWFVPDDNVENPSGVAAWIVLAICKETMEPVMINSEHVNERYYWWLRCDEPSTHRVPIPF